MQLQLCPWLCSSSVQLYSASMDSVIEVSVPLHLASIYLQSDLNARPLRRTLAPTTGNNVRSRSTRIFPMEEHIFPLIFDYLIFEERREKAKRKKVGCARNVWVEVRKLYLIWESAHSTMRILHSFSNFLGRKKTFYQFSIRGKEGEDEGKDRIEKCTEGVKKLCLANMSINM